MPPLAFTPPDFKQHNLYFMPLPQGHASFLHIAIQILILDYSDAAIARRQSGLVFYVNGAIA
ncbi:hypothetical protein SAMN02745866_02981 [Alteromonadaceae bacterium Bs31]|nr:hypothetical protein SAMN02745866_02981 [Alteromonadaceae bacterium Bs31]